MPVVPLRALLKQAAVEGYGVPAINIFNDLTLEAVLAAAEEARSPLIVQTSVKTVRSIGHQLLFAMWSELTRAITVPVSLHLDHCPDRAVITECLRAGWNSVLFDASSLPVEENERQTRQVVEEANAFGADVEGEIEPITGVEDDIGSDVEGQRQDLVTALTFIRSTGIAIFAPSIGNAHGLYSAAPELDVDRVSQLVGATGIAIALHGGTGMTDLQFKALISRGCVKINISTALKMTYMQAALAHLSEAQRRDTWDPPAMFVDVRTAVMTMATDYMRLFGSIGMA